MSDLQTIKRKPEMREGSRNNINPQVGNLLFTFC